MDARISQFHRMPWGTKLTVLVSACVASLAMAQPEAASPTTAPAATTRPAMKAYTCLFSGGIPAFTGHANADLPTLQQVQPEFLDVQAGQAKRNRVSLFVDHEPKDHPTVGIAATRDVSRLASLDTWVRDLHNLVRRAREASGINADPPDAPKRIVAAYTDLPVGLRWQYGDDQKAYVVDNQRVAAADPLRGVDALCVQAYIHIDDAEWMHPAAAQVAARRRIQAAKIYGKPIILFLCPTYVATPQARDVPEEILRAILNVARAEGVDVCLWSDREQNVVQARQRALRFKEMVDEANAD